MVPGKVGHIGGGIVEGAVAEISYSGAGIGGDVVDGGSGVPQGAECDVVERLCGRLYISERCVTACSSIPEIRRIVAVIVEISGVIVERTADSSGVAEVVRRIQPDRLVISELFDLIFEVE